jgi:hypothetical protein
MKAWVHRQEMRQVSAALVLQIIDPRDLDRLAALGLDGQGRRMKGAVFGRGAVCPHCGRTQRRRQDLLRDLPDRDDVCARARSRHRLWNRERRDEFRDVADIQRAAGDRTGNRLLVSESAEREQRQRRSPRIGEKVPTVDHCAAPWIGLAGGIQ